MRRPLVLLAVIVALAVGVAAQPVNAHLDLAEQNGYLWEGACGSGRHGEPVNVVFAGVDSADDLMTHFDDHRPGWNSQAGSAFRFSQDDGACALQDFQRATGGIFSLSRDHIRFKEGHSSDPAYGDYYLAAAHRDSMQLCLGSLFFPHHEGTSFNLVRDSIAAAFEAGGHRVDWISVGNTEPAFQICLGNQAGDGLVAVIWVPPMEPQTPTVSLGSLSTTVGLEGTVTLQALAIGMPGLGAWTIDINYDPSVVSVVDCISLHDGVCNSALAFNAIRVTGAIAQGLRGETTLAVITFECRTGGLSPLSLSLQVFIDDTVGAPQPIDAATEEGSITCQPAKPTPPPTPTPTRTPTNTPTNTPTPTPTPVRPTPTFTLTPTLTRTSTPTLAPSPVTLVGDVDCSFEVTSVDAALVLQYVAGLLEGLECQSVADVDLDGTINSIDAALILQHAAGLIDSLPPT